MSHLAVLVCLPARTTFGKLDETLFDTLERWNENRRVTPYRDYVEESAPTDFWWVKTIWKMSHEVALDDDEILARAVRDAPGDAPVARHSLVVDRLETDARVIADRRARARKMLAVRDRLGEWPTWADVTREYNAYYPEGESYSYDEERGRPYLLSTYNPESRWNRWIVGGIRCGRLIARVDANPGELVHGQPGACSGRHAGARLGCDGGRLRALDLERMRVVAGDEAGVRHDVWSKLVRLADAATLTPWSVYRSRVVTGELRPEEARLAFEEQPAVFAAHKILLVDVLEDPVDTFSASRDEYVESARRGAVPGDALVTLDGEWVSGHMYSDLETYHVEVNDYVESLPDDTIIVNVDTHI